MSIATDGIKQTNNSKWALAKAKAMGLRLSSGKRSVAGNAAVGGHPKSKHVEGTAYDFVGTRTQMLAFAKVLADSKKFTSVIFDNKDYMRGNAYVANHQDHVHIEWNPNVNENDKEQTEGIIKEGAVGSIVAAIQKLLGGLKVDGFFGADTEKAVKEFQEDNGLLVDGIVGKKTFNELTGGAAVFFGR